MQVVDLKSRWPDKWEKIGSAGNRRSTVNNPSRRSGSLGSRQNSILKINNIEVKYHEVILVLKGVSIEVPEGGIVALLGANGAGKSTTLKAISGLLKHEDGQVTDGSIEFMGQRIDRMPPEKIARMGIVQVIEGRRVFEHLTVEENLKVGAHLRKFGRSVKEGLEMVYHYFPRLYEKRNETAGFDQRRGAADDRGGPGPDDQPQADPAG